MIRVYVNGAGGRMGSVTVQAIQAAEGLELCGTGDVGDDLAAGLSSTRAQVMVDFTVPSAAPGNARLAVAQGVRPVIGTTGWTESAIADLAAQCAEARVGGVLAANFSLGAILMQRVGREIAAHMPDVEILEAHHPAKLDAPSGTAVATAKGLAGARPPADGPGPGWPASRGERHHGIPVHSLRLTGLLAEQELRFGAPGETLTVVHRTYSREAFMPGVVLSCRKVPARETLIVGLEELLFGD